MTSGVIVQGVPLVLSSKNIQTKILLLEKDKITTSDSNTKHNSDKSKIILFFVLSASFLSMQEDSNIGNFIDDTDYYKS